MHALAVYPPIQLGGAAASLRDVDIQAPTPGPKEVQVRVYASTINIDDIHMVEGSMFGGIPVGPKVASGQPVVLGSDVAGVVSAIGSKVRGFAIGDAVFGIHDPRDPRGGWAEYSCVQEARLSRKPETWSFAEAAACGLGGLVAVAALERAAPTRTCRSIVAGASSGIGNIIAQALVRFGADVVGVCSTRNIERVRAFGVTPFDYTKESFADRYSGVDIVIDCVGGQEIEAEGFRALHPGGRFVTLVGPERYIGERRLPWRQILGIFAHILVRSLWGRIKGPKYAMVAPTARHRTLLDRWLIEPGVRPLLDREVEMNAAAVADAIRHVLSHRASGKVVVVAPDPWGRRSRAETAAS